MWCMEPSERYSAEELWDADNAFTTCDDADLRLLVAKALSRAPKEVADFVYCECLLQVVRMSDKGVYFSARDWGRDHHIIFSEALFGDAEDQAIETILHEVAHAYCRHVQPRCHPELSVEQTMAQEHEADEVAAGWLEMSTEAFTSRRLSGGASDEDTSGE